MVALVTAGLLFIASSALAFGVNECAAERKGSDLGCTAGDVSITGIAVAPGSPTSCVGGTTFLVDLDITVNFATPDRWDIGIFLSQDGKDPQDHPSNGGSTSCSVGILPTTSPFLDLDPNGGTDTCGDGNGAINGGTGSGVVRLSNVPVACQAINLSGGNLFIPFVVSWDNQGSPTGDTCTSIADPVPNTVSKCNAPKTTVATEVSYGTVNAVVLPAITKTDNKTTVNPGNASTYTVVITNTTGVPLSNAVFTDPAAPNLTVGSVSCSAAGGATCPAATVAAMQGAGVTIPTMPVDSSVTFTINATVANPVLPSYTNLVTNTAYVTVGPLGPTPPANRKSNSASDSDAVIGAVYSDLSTSTKSVIDLNGGEADPGDVLRYTISVDETAGLIAANGVTVTDHIPAYVNSFAIVSIPAGATNASTGSGTGSNGNGYLNVTGITVPANGSATIVFDVTIAAGTPAGTKINNIATVTNPGGPGGNPPAPPVTVSPSAVQATNNKQLYLYGGGASPYTMSRNKPTGAPTTAAIGSGGSATWTGNNPVPLQLNNTISSAYVSLYLTADSTQDRKVAAQLYCSSSATAYATSGEYNLGAVPATPTPYTFNLTNLVGGFSFPATCTTPNYWMLRVVNASSAGRNIVVVPTSGADYSRVNLASSNIIYVNTPTFYDAPYPAGAVVASAYAGTTVYIRSDISDPFGSFDISGARIDITNPVGTQVVTAAAMTEKVSSGAIKTYEFAYTIPAGGPGGYWVARVNATEGSEGTVSDDAVASVQVVIPMPSLLIVKSAQTYSDPINDQTSPKAIPGAFMLYTIQVTNTGPGTVDAGTTVVTDPIPANTELFVGDIDGAGSGPVLFADGATASGLGYSFISLANAADSLSFSDNGGTTYTKNNTTPDANACDPTVTNLKVSLGGIFAASNGVNHPSFSLMFKVRVK